MESRIRDPYVRFGERGEDKSNYFPSTLLLFSSLVTYIIIPLIFKNGKTLGKFASKLNVVSDNYEYASWYKIIIRSILSIIFNIYLAIFSLGMVPLFSLLIAISSKDNKAIPDFICKTIVVDAKIPIEVKRIKD